MSTIINTRSHTFAQALECKRNNTTLSTRTLKKLTLIANKEFGGSADRVFGRTTGLGFNGDARGLCKAISSQLNSVCSPAMEKVMCKWLGRLPLSLPSAAEATQPSAPPSVASARIAAWLARSPADAATQANNAPAARGPEPTYCEIPEIPPVDYEGGTSPEPEIPPPDYLRFSDSVEVVHLTEAESQEDRKGVIERNTEAPSLTPE